MHLSTLRRGLAALTLTVAVTAGAAGPLHAQAAGSGCTSGQWTVMSTPVLAPDSYLEAVAAISPTDVWAAGFEAQDASRTTDNPSTELYEHWDGIQWSVVPGPGVTDALITSLAGTSSSDVWAFGSIEGELPLVEHWNGVAWQQMSSPLLLPSTQLLGGVALSAGDAWAVGTEDAEGVVTGILEHWNGHEWSVAQTFSGMPFRSIAATGDSNLWISAGWATEHWDGSTWTEAPTATTASGDSTSIYGVAAAGAEVLGAGNSYSPLDPSTQAAELQSWNGSAWTDGTPATSSTGNASFYRISAASATDAWTVGLEGSPFSPIAAHWDGTQWTSITPVSPTGTDELYDVSALPGQAWGVGQTWDAAILREQPLIETYCA